MQEKPTAKMNVCWCIAFSIVLSVLFLGSSCTAVEGDENDLPDKLHKHNTAKGGLKHVLRNDGLLLNSRRSRELGGRDQNTEIEDNLQKLSKTVKGMQAEHGYLVDTLSKQRTQVEEMDQKLLTVQNDIKKIQQNILQVNGIMEKLATEVQAVETDTRNLNATASKIITWVQQLYRNDKGRTAQINKLEAKTSWLMSAVSPESSNERIVNPIPAAEMHYLHQQIVRDTQRAKPVTVEQKWMVCDWTVCRYVIRSESPEMN